MKENVRILQQMDLWRMHIRPKGTEKARKHPEDVVRFCLTGGREAEILPRGRRYYDGIIGLGWDVGEKRITSFEEYKALAQLKYKRNPVLRFAKQLKIGELVWFRDTNGIYYLARVMGDWEYRLDKAYMDLNIPNVRRAVIIRIDTRVPGGIINRFIAGSTLQRIHSRPLLIYSLFTWDGSCDKSNLQYGSEYIREIAKRYFTDEGNSQDHAVFSLLPPEDLEDLVAVYLQQTKGYMLVPSSRGKRDDTIKYEYELIPRFSAGYRNNALVQVKTGQNLSLAEYEELGAAVKKDVYLFTLGSYEQYGESVWVKTIKPKELLEFWVANAERMPMHLQHWLHVWEKIRILKK